MQAHAKIVNEMLGHVLFSQIDQDRYPARIDLGGSRRKGKDVVHFCEYGNAFTKNSGVDDKMIFVDQTGPDKSVGEGCTSIGDHVLAREGF